MLRFWFFDGEWQIGKVSRRQSCKKKYPEIIFGVYLFNNKNVKFMRL